MILKRIGGVIAGLAAVGIIVFLILSRSSTPKNAALAARQRAMERLGQEIVKLRPDCKVLVLSNPFTKDSGLLDKNAQFERAGVRGLRNGVGASSPVTVVFPEIKPEYFSDRQSVSIPPDCRTPLSFLLRSGVVEELADAHPDCRVIVSLIGFPAGLDQGKLWNQDDPRSLALLLPDLRILGPPEKTIEAFERGKILTVVAENADQPGTPLIITRENVQEVLKREPAALGY